ncbi:Mutator mutT protein (7,8-dihydro-8-oxoguanine-triphosphatase) / Thiamin-phosphate pyrophosphorylase-like protein [Enhydrobacter sp. AX1]|nr:Mutator mutT protein (7,8-dihydro-8-oxoguanine-triphosphatase) / Thiamin-phosphate pyrophosphorylase-like protein [Enhydrobacter sp. AX1]
MGNNQQFEKNMSKIVNVAVAVIHFNNQYLLGFRHASQHQGNRYEFVGGKIEPNETPIQGLIREVHEEIGLDIAQDTAVKMGVIRHDYADKIVVLHVFKIRVSQAQFDGLQEGKGKEGQAVTWVRQSDLVANQYPLPDANARILDWLKLPNAIYITQPLDSFVGVDKWVDFYSQKLPDDAHCYLRPQTSDENATAMIDGLLRIRADITPIIQYATLACLFKCLPERLDAWLKNGMVHLNHQQLMTLDFSSLSKNYRYFASCHDQHSLSRLNTLATSHTVMGCFLSPVKATPTHPETFQSGGMGWQTLSELAKICDVPVFALGGLEQADLATAYEHGAMGIAGIRLLVDKV